MMPGLRYHLCFEPEMPEHIARWGRPYGMEGWNMHIKRMETFAKLRPVAMGNLINDFFKLGGKAEIVIGAVPEGYGIIKLNSLVLEPGPQGWNGTYFKSVPITLTAIPMHGYQFVGWQGDVVSQDPAITIELTDDVTIKPVFERQ